jgi:hypothetical protein
MDKGKTVHGVSEESQLQMLTGAYPDEADAIAAINFAITKNWANVNLTGNHKQVDLPNRNGKPKQSNQDKLKAILGT